MLCPNGRSRPVWSLALQAPAARQNDLQSAMPEHKVAGHCRIVSIPSRGETRQRTLSPVVEVVPDSKPDMQIHY